MVPHLLSQSDNWFHAIYLCLRFCNILERSQPSLWWLTNSSSVLSLNSVNLLPRSVNCFIRLLTNILWAKHVFFLGGGYFEWNFKASWILVQDNLNLKQAEHWLKATLGPTGHQLKGDPGPNWVLAKRQPWDQLGTVSRQAWGQLSTG